MRKDIMLVCPHCGEKKPCPRSWFMYKRNDWIGYICMFYCRTGDTSWPVFKLYDKNFHYVAWVSSMSWAMDMIEEIPF